MHDFTTEELKAARAKVDELRNQAYSLVIETLQEDDSTLPDVEVFVLYKINADSYTGTRTLSSIHQTLKGALMAIPPKMRTDELLRISSRPSSYILDFAYYAIEKGVIGA